MKLGPWHESSAGGLSLFCGGGGTDIAGGTVDGGPQEQNLLQKPSNLGVCYINELQQEELVRDTNVKRSN